MTSPAPSGPVSSDPIIVALQQVLAAQHAAIYAYPLIGITVSSDAQTQHARTREAAHRTTRDALMAQLAAKSVTPVFAAASYTPSEPVHDDTSAQRWALQLEDACAGAYRVLLGATAMVTAPAIRRQAMQGLGDAATQCLYWRTLLTPITPTVPFPGAD